MVSALVHGRDAGRVKTETHKIVYVNALPHYEGSTPSLSKFDPKFIPAQFDAVKLVREWPYKILGKLELLLSGALGSSKSLVLAHLALSHCLMFPRARFGIARRTMPDLKSTLFQKILEHIGDDLVEGRDYVAAETKAKIRFSNGSEIVGRSWADRKGGKSARSVDLSALAIEELTENDDTKDKEAILELINRVGRLPHVPESFVVHATNPDEPDHWAYQRFMVNPPPTRKVIYSVTTDNPFLPFWYREQLLADMDPKMADRMLFGKWISIAKENVYHAYDAKLHEPAEEYVVDPLEPIVMSWDFNIGFGKPMSVTFSQMRTMMIGGRMQRAKCFFDEIVVPGARTQGILEEAWERGRFDVPTVYLIRGDQTGMHADTRQNLNDYLLIDEWLRLKARSDGTAVMFRRQVPLSNPPVRSRHNVSNAWLLNNLGDVRVQVYPKCKVLREGFKLVKLLDRAQYKEDDSKYFQHVTTAATYDIHYEHVNATRGTTTVQQRG